MQAVLVLLALPICATGFIAAIAASMVNPKLPWDTMGQMGDYFGGFLNPLLSFAAFAGVIFSIILQRDDIKRQEKASNMQRFESISFQMFQIYGNIVSATAFKDDASGRDAFRFMYEVLSRRAGIQYRSNKSVISVAQECYQRSYTEHRQSLGHYFRYLYNLIRFIDDHRDIPDKEKLALMKILRSMITDYELLLIYFNAASPQGENFKYYIKKYSILNNMDVSLLPDYDFINLRVGMGDVGRLEPRDS